MAVLIINPFIHGGGAPPAESDALVADAGTGAANGTYTYTGTENGKRYYNLPPETSAGRDAVMWDTTQWAILDNGGFVLYYSTEDTTYPWEVVTWTEDGGDSPAPTVTEV